MKKTLRKPAKPPSSPGDRREPTDASTSAVEPGLIQALYKINDNLTRVIDTKVATVLEATKEQTSQLQAVATGIDDAQKRIADVEQVATSSETKIAPLQKQVCSMQ